MWYQGKEHSMHTDKGNISAVLKGSVCVCFSFNRAGMCAAAVIIIVTKQAHFSLTKQTKNKLKVVAQLHTLTFITQDIEYFESGVFSFFSFSDSSFAFRSLSFSLFVAFFLFIILFQFFCRKWWRRAITCTK